LLAVGLWDKMTIWNVRTRALVATIPKGGTSLAFFPGGRRLASMGMAHVRIWNAEDWREEKTIPDVSGTLTIAPDGRRLATVSREGVHVWDTETWGQIRLLEDAWGPTAFAPDGRSLVTDSSAGLAVWTLAEDRPPVPLRNSTNLFARGGPWFRNDRVLAFSPDGKSVVAARNTLSARGVFVLGIWDAGTGQETATLPDDPEHIEHTGAISSLAISPDGRLLATASMDRSLRLWDLTARQAVADFQGHLAEVWATAFSADGQTLISGAKDGSVKLWPVHRPKKKDDVMPELVQPLAFNRTGSHLAALNREGAVAILNMNTSEPEKTFPVERRRGRFGPPPAITLSADLRTLACGQDNGSVKLWNTETREFTILKVADNPVDFLALTPDGRTLVTGGRFQGLRCWDLRAGTNTVLDTDAFPGLLSPDGLTLVTLARDNIIELWDVPTRTRRLTIESESQPNRVAACSPDGQTLAMVGFDDSVSLWNMATGRQFGACTGHKQAVFSVAFSPDGKTLATAADDSTLKLWNVATQQELISLRRLGGALRNLVFSPDGRLLAGRSGSFTSEGLRFYRAPLGTDPAP
jgi:WD40 repeat protein